MKWVLYLTSIMSCYRIVNYAHSNSAVAHKIIVLIYPSVLIFLLAIVTLCFSSTYILGKILGQMLVQMYLKKFASPMKPLDPGPYAKAHPMAQYDKAPIKPSSMFLIRMFTVFLDLKMMIIIKSKLIL
jgi:hypothetical protein